MAAITNGPKPVFCFSTYRETCDEMFVGHTGQLYRPVRTVDVPFIAANIDIAGLFRKTEITTFYKRHEGVVNNGRKKKDTSLAAGKINNV